PFAAPTQVFLDDPEVKRNVVADEAQLRVGEEEASDVVGMDQATVVLAGAGRGQSQAGDLSAEVHDLRFGIEGEEAGGGRQQATVPAAEIRIVPAAEGNAVRPHGSLVAAGQPLQM